MKTIENRKARFKYNILDTLEVGLQLTGTEIKSVRQGQVSIAEAFLTFQQNGLFLLNATIPPYSHGNIANHEPTRSRKCLASKKELLWLRVKIEEKGHTLIPLKLYFKKRWLKCLLGVCKGKQAHDKRQTIKERDLKRQSEKAIKRFKNS
jgi:SsrA-binding protein